MTAVETRRGPRSADSFVGRLEQREALDQMIRESARGAVRVAVIEGDAGIGKTHLLQVMLEQAQWLGIRTFIGRSEEMTAERPFGSIRDALDTKRADGARARANELLRRPDQQGLTFAIADALLDVVEEDVARGPILIALEDAHWADSGTLVAIRAISKLEAVPLALVITTRSRPRRGELASLLIGLAKDGATRVDLTGLSADECDALARSVLGDDGVAPCPELVSRTGGNPLFLLEVVRSALPGGEQSQLNDAAIPAGLKKVLLESVASLDGRGVEALQVASVLGDGFHPAELAAVMDTSIVDLLPRLTDAVARGLVVEEGDGLRFRHSLIRDAIYSDLPAGIARALHRKAATGLGASGASPLRVAEHLVRSADPGDQEAIEWLDRAAEATPDPAAASGLLRKRISLSVRETPGVPEARLSLVRSLHAAGQVDEALSIGEALLAEQPSDDLVFQLRLLLSYLYYDRSRLERAEELIEAALQMDGLTRHQRAAAMGWQVSLLVYLRPADAIARAREVVAMVAGEVAEIAALVALCDPLYRAGQVDEAIATGERAISLARSSGQARYLVDACHITGWAYLNAGRTADARAMFLEALAAADRCHAITYVTQGHESLGQLAFAVGDWDEALLQWETSDGYRRQYEGQAWMDTSLCRSYVLAHRGETRAARACLTRALADKAMYSNWRLTLSWCGALITGLANVRQGAAELARLWPEVKQDPNLLHLRFLGDAIRLLHDGGLPETARDVVDSLPAVARHSRPRWIRAMLSTDVDELDEARAEAALGHPSVSRSWLYVQCAAAEVDRGGVAAARELFGLASADVEHLGAVQVSRAVRARMRECGLRVGSTAPRRRARRGWEALTAQEKEVVKLASEGFTNPQIGEQLFISKRTVGTHLANVFRKLGVSSRSALRDYRDL